jgi:hypothetical protein
MGEEWRVSVGYSAMGLPIDEEDTTELIPFESLQT